MTFKTESQQSKNSEMSDKLYQKFINLIQFEIDKLVLITSCKIYFHNKGLVNYKKFFESLYKVCDKQKECLLYQLVNNKRTIPEFTVPALVIDFSDNISPFKTLSEMEDLFESKLKEMITIASEDNDWNNFQYLLEKLSKLDHICCRVLSAVENNADISLLCEQHISEK